jgi:hypothetical protein
MFVAALLGTCILASLSPHGDKILPFAAAQIALYSSDVSWIFKRRSSMATDSRDVIWDEAQVLLYRVSYAEGLKTALLRRWAWLDSISKIAVAVSSAGAALAGLVFWKNTDYTFLWPMFTSTSTLLAIISNQLDVAEKLKRHATSATELRSLSIDIGSLLMRMKINPDFSIQDFEERLLELREKYRADASKFSYDLLLTRRLRIKTQESINNDLEIS